MLRHNQSLHTLNLNVGKLGDEGAAIIAESLTNHRSLENLNLASNDIGRDGAWKIAEAIQISTSLRSLNLGYDKSTRVLGEKPNRIGDTGCVAISEMIAVNRSLRHLDLARNEIANPGAALVLQSIKSNDQITSIVLGRGVSRAITRQLSALLLQNESRHGAYQPRDWQDIVAIRSVYRS